MHQLHIDKQTYYFPESWNEITSQQLLYLCRLTLDKVNITELKTKMFLYFTGIRVFNRKQRIFEGIEHYLMGTSKETAWWISVNDLVFITQSLDFLLKEIRDKDGKYICHDLNSKLTTNLLPEIELPSRLWFSDKYYGPSNGLTNLIFDEWIDAEINLTRFRETQKEVYLHKFIAVLYRPRKSRKAVTDIHFDGDIRLPYNNSFIESRAKEIAKLPEEYKKAIVVWYDGCKAFLRAKYPNVFCSSDENEEHEPGSEAANFMRLVDSIAESDPTKKPMVRKSYLYEVLESLEHAQIRAKLQQEEIERMKNQ